MAKAKAKKPPIDWESIEQEVRARQLSIREIARRYGCSPAAISQRKKSEGWDEDDLSKDVRKRIRNKLVKEESTDEVNTELNTLLNTPNARVNTEKVNTEAEAEQRAIEDDEIIEKAADRGVEVIKCQRKDIQRLREAEAQIIAELIDSPTKLYLAQYQGKVVEKTVDLTVSEKSQAVNNLANTMFKRIQLERQAYNLDETDDESGKDLSKLSWAELERIARGE